MVLTDFIKDTGKSLLNKGVGVKLNHSMLVEIFNYVVEVTVVIIYNTPTNSPAWKTVNLGY